MKNWLIIIITLTLTNSIRGQDDTVRFKSFQSIMPISGTGDMAIEERVNLFFQAIPEEKLIPLINENELDVSIFKKIVYQEKFNKESLLINRIQSQNKDLGLSITGNVRYNITYKSQASLENDKTRYNLVAGIQWDVLESGWKSSQIKVKKLTKEFEIQRLEQKNNEDQTQFPFRQRQIVTLFNYLLLDELKYHAKLYEHQITLYLEMYYENLIPYTPIIELKREKERVELEINRLEKYNENFDQHLFKEARQMPIFDIELEALLQNYEENNLSDSLAFKKKELLDYVYKAKNMPSLGIMGQYRAFQSTNSSKVSHSPVINITFKMPINRGKTFDTRSKTYETKIIEEELDLSKGSDSRLIVDFYSNYQSQLEELKGMYYELFAEKEHYNASKIIKNRIEKTQVNSTFSRLNKILGLRKDIILAQQKLYLIALQLFTVTGTQHLVNAKEVIKPIEWQAVRPNQAIIVLDVTKDLSDIQFYMSYLQRKNYNKIYLKGQEDKSYALTLNMLQMEGFEVYSDMNPTILRVEVADFQRIQMLKRFITNSERKIILSDLHQLIDLEVKSL